MTEKEIVRQDLIDVAADADRDAQRIRKYLLLGFTPQQIVQTRAQIFFRRLKKVLDPETVATIQVSWQDTEPLTHDQAVWKICWELAGALLDVIIEEMKSPRP